MNAYFDSYSGDSKCSNPLFVFLFTLQEKYETVTLNGPRQFFFSNAYLLKISMAILLFIATVGSSVDRCFSYSKNNADSEVFTLNKYSELSLNKNRINNGN
jgi:hypothetical protein